MKDKKAKVMAKQKGKERKKVWDAGRQQEVLAPLERMMIAAVYGYNNQKTSTHQCMDRLWKTAFDRIDAYRRTNKTATVILLGDLNAAKDPQLDTNRSHYSKSREEDAHIIEAIEALCPPPPILAVPLPLPPALCPPRSAPRPLS